MHLRTNTNDPIVFPMFWSVRLYKASCNQLAKAFGFGGVGGLFFSSELGVSWNGWFISWNIHL